MAFSRQDGLCCVRNETRNYIVFFAYDTAMLTPDARNIVVQAAANVKAVKPVRIDLGGYPGPGVTKRPGVGLCYRVGSLRNLDPSPGAAGTSDSNVG